MGADSGSLPRLSVTTQWVLECLLDDPSREWSAMDLARANGLREGSVYPVLAKLEAVGWLHSRWEDVPPGPARAPARRSSKSPDTPGRFTGAAWGV